MTLDYLHNPCNITFEEALLKVSHLITKVCYHFSDSKADFDDLRQEVLINLWKGWNNFRHDSKLTTWVYRIAFNTCVSYTRKNHVKSTTPFQQILDIPDTPSFNIEQYNEMHSLINRLKPEEKAIILMWLDENNYEEIAEVMGVNRNNIATRIRRIKEKLIRLSNQ